jgi:endonuclease-3|tara:strand:+ start:576 stop:1268 length:693 start_codon:yes stop_codon:yes gene_type:complete
MKNSNDIEYIYEKLSSLYPNYANKKPKAKIYSKAYTSLIGVMLSAQSQDKRTAIACRQLFSLANTPEDMLKLTQEEVIEAIRPAGLFNAKSKNILATSKMLLEEFSGRVPQTQKELMTLPGVGRKSSDIVMRFVFGEPHIAVDTHVFRMLWRLGWADSLDEGKASITVNNTTPSKYKYGAHMWLITHAKYVCKSGTPVCNECVITDACDRRDITVPKSKLRQKVSIEKYL